MIITVGNFRKVMSFLQRSGLQMREQRDWEQLECGEQATVPARDG